MENKRLTRHRKMYSIGVDIGGTFTDIALISTEKKQVFVGKVLTDYQDLARGVMTGIRSVLEQNGIEAASIGRVVHGTTLVTNCLIERRGAKTALIVTQGFGDVLALGRESRYDIYDVDIELPQPLVDRNAIFEVVERMDYKGEVILPLDTKSLQRAIAQIKKLKIDSVAICLLHAYANSHHEKIIADAVIKALPGISLSLSSQVMPDIREYERMSTTCANAYVQPIVKGYLDRLGEALQDLGVHGELCIMSSDGAVLDMATACQFPVRLTESGPAGGAIAAAHLGLASQESHLIAYDMGGTTAKICIIENGEPLKSHQFEFGRVYRFAKGSGLPLQIPVIEMIEIGAGGGSIAGLNEIGMLQIGPQSANASPGPACYGLGGVKPTVTDADLVLGYLSSDSFLGGDMHLHLEKARQAIHHAVAKPLGLSVEEAAYAIHRVVNANMARAAKVHCLEHGKDARRMTLFAYGGAGPVHGFGVAQILGVSQILYPCRAGVMSALGFLVAQPSFEILRGRMENLLEINLARLNALLREMEQEATLVVRKSVGQRPRLQVHREVAIRYEGQSYELYIPVATGVVKDKTLQSIAKDFSLAYSKRYQALAEHDRLESVRWRVRVSGVESMENFSFAMKREKRLLKVKECRLIYVPEKKRYVRCPVYDRYRLPYSALIKGPALIEERESTVYLGSYSRAHLTSNGDLKVIVEKKN